MPSSVHTVGGTKIGPETNPGVEGSEAPVCRCDFDMLYAPLGTSRNDESSALLESGAASEYSGMAAAGSGSGSASL